MHHGCGVVSGEQRVDLRGVAAMGDERLAQGADDPLGVAVGQGGDGGGVRQAVDEFTDPGPRSRALTLRSTAFTSDDEWPR